MNAGTMTDMTLSAAEEKDKEIVLYQLGMQLIIETTLKFCSEFV